MIGHPFSFCKRCHQHDNEYPAAIHPVAVMREPGWPSRKRQGGFACSLKNFYPSGSDPETIVLSRILARRLQTCTRP